MSGGRRQISVLLMAATCSLLAVPGYGTGNAGNDRGEALSTFKLTRVTQEPADNGYKVQLHLQGAPPTAVYLLRGRSRIQTDLLLAPRDGVAEFHSEAGNRGVLLLYPRGYQIISLNIGEQSPPEHLVPDIEFFVQEGRNVTFARGNDADVHVVFSVDNIPEGSWYDFRTSMFVKSNTEDHVVERHGQWSAMAFRILNESQSGSEKHAHLRLKTSSGNVEGLLGLDGFLSLDCRSSNSCLLLRYRLHEDIPVYERDHDGPFPDHYIGGVKSWYERQSKQVFCSARQISYCQLRCEFVGDRPSSVEFVRVSGHLTGLSEVSVSNNGFWALGSMSFQNVTTLGEVEYRCQSRSRSSPASEPFSRTLHVLVVLDARINEELTSVSFLDNGTLEIVCVAEGVPPPTLSFHNRNLNISALYGDASRIPCEFDFSQPNNSTSVGVVRVSNPDVARNMTYVICSARNEVHGRVFRNVEVMRVPRNASVLNPTVRSFQENGAV